MTQPQAHPLGVSLDGGGGALRWAAWRGEREVAAGELPGAVLQLVGWELYVDRLREALHVAVQHAEAQVHDIETLGMGLSGVDRPQEVEQIYAWVRSELPGVTACWAGNDAWPALRAGAGELCGILLIAGTGSVCLGAVRRGDELVHVRVGGWGGVLDDAGSAFWLGRELVREAVRAADGRSEQRAILELVMARWEIMDPLQIIPYINQRTLGEQRALLSSVAPWVGELAREHHVYAKELMKRGAREIAAMVEACQRRLTLKAGLPGDAQLPVIGHGGPLRHWPEYLAAIREELKTMVPDAEFQVLESSPLLGALALAGEFPFLRL